MDYYSIFEDPWTFFALILNYNNMYRLKKNEIRKSNGIIIKILTGKCFGIQVESYDDEKN